MADQGTVPRPLLRDDENSVGHGILSILGLLPSSAFPPGLKLVELPSTNITPQNGLDRYRGVGMS